MKRIRYTKDSNGNYITLNHLKTRDGIELVAGFIGTDPKTPTQGFIKSTSIDAIHLNLSATSHHKIKIKIKKALEKIGCSFEKEMRTVEPKSETDQVPTT